jgi:hypothetical protein
LRGPVISKLAAIAATEILAFAANATMVVSKYAKHEGNGKPPGRIGGQHPRGRPEDAPKAPPPLFFRWLLAQASGKAQP